MRWTIEYKWHRIGLGGVRKSVSSEELASYRSWEKEGKLRIIQAVADPH